MEDNSKYKHMFGGNLRRVKSESPKDFFNKERIKKVVELKKEGVSHMQIAKRLSMSRWTVIKVNKMMEKYPHLVK